MMYDSWDMKPNRQNIFVILDILPFYPTNNPKTQNFEKMKKKPGDISSFYTGVPEIMIICYKIPEIWREIIFIFHFGLFFPFYPPNSPKNHNFKKVKIFFIILHVYQKLWSDDLQFLRSGARRMVRETDGWMEGQTERPMDDGKTDGRTDILKDGQTDWWMDRWKTDRWTEGQIHQHTDR